MVRKVVSRALVVGVLSAGALGLGAGVASADETPIWVVPGVDLGSVLDPTVGLPAGALGPVDSVLTYLAG